MPLAFLASLCETDSPGTGEVARSARRGAVAPQGRRERTVPLPEIFRAAANFSPPAAAAAAPSQRGQEGYPANNRKKQEKNIHGQTQ